MREAMAVNVAMATLVICGNGRELTDRDRMCDAYCEAMCELKDPETRGNAELVGSAIRRTRAMLIRSLH